MKCDLIRVMDLGETFIISFIFVFILIAPSITIPNKDEEFESITDLSERQLAEFTMLGKFKLGQIRSQLEYETFLENYELNQYFHLNMVGISAFQKSRSANNTKCYEGLGCIEFTEEWYDLLSRPVNLFPLEREVINTEFLLVTRDDRRHRKLTDLSRKAVRKQGLRVKRETKFIIHGFLDHGDVDWIKDMATALVTAEDVNVVIVDWRGGSLPLYSQAAANTRLVGMEVARMVEGLRLDPARVHIIGHSLGAHIAGYAGERLPGLGRISGLDPAEPLFQGMPTEVRLDAGDARFVDVIHTDSKGFYKGGLGMEQAVGHVDFYPNGGKVQPGCSFLDFPYMPTISGDVDTISLPAADSVARNLFACGHNRVIDLYTDSILSSGACPMVGHKCDSYEEFQAGDCFSCDSDGGGCSVLGYGATKHRAWTGSSVKMFLDTDSSPPYCTHLYLLELDLAQPREAETWVQGYLSLSLVGDKDSLLEHEISPDESVKYYHGEAYKYMIKSPTDLGKITVVQIHWIYDDEMKLFDLSRICLMFLCSKHLYTNTVTVNSVAVEKGSLTVMEDHTSLCSEEQRGLGFTEVTNGDWKTFYKECDPARY